MSYQPFDRKFTSGEYKAYDEKMRGQSHGRGGRDLQCPVSPDISQFVNPSAFVNPFECDQAFAVSPYQPFRVDPMQQSSGPAFHGRPMQQSSGPAFHGHYYHMPSHSGHALAIEKQSGQKFVPPAINATKPDTLRPYASACRKTFFHLMLLFDRDCSDGKTVIIKPDTAIEFVSTDGRQQSWVLSTTIYGKPCRDYRDREPTHKKYGIVSPFVALQHEFLEFGLHLLNISDPEKSKNIVLKVFSSKQSNKSTLWHGQDISPISNLSEKTILKKFYRAKDDAAAARFVNEVFAKKRDA